MQVFRVQGPDCPGMVMQGVIATDRIVLRSWRESDREPFAAMNADPRVMHYFPDVLTREESDAALLRIRRHFEVHGFGLLAAELRSSGDFIGFTGFAVPPFEAHFTPCVEIGWRLLPSFWNRGLATEAARAVAQWGFETLGLHEIVSFTSTLNVPSQRVMEKLGMSHDAGDDFDHPALPEGHWLQRHVLYRLRPAICVF